jgi:putative two-component system response regulator
LRADQIDLALLDVMMPCRTIKSKPETRLIPVVLVTGLTDSGDRIQGIEAGADDFLGKPVNKEELLARVRSLLRLKQFTDELENAETVLFSLALSIEAKDPYTEGHCGRLSKYFVALAKRLGLPEELRVALRRAGIVHDIGKVAVPEHILLKPGAAHPRRVEDHEGASRHRGAHLCPAEILPPRPTYHPLPPREARWIGISRRTERRGDPPDRPDPANGGHL